MAEMHAAPLRGQAKDASPELARSLQCAVSEWRSAQPVEQVEITGSERRIRVFARIRPLLGETLGSVTSRGGVDVNEFECVSRRGRCVVLHSEVAGMGGTSTGTLSHSSVEFDGVLDDVDAAVALDGETSVICFGQTNSGKTFTTTECLERAVARLELPIHISFIEVARNRVRDLLADGRECALLDDGLGALKVSATETMAATREEAWRVIEGAASRRATRATRANDKSSRSHAICTLNRSHRFVDLAGSERRQEALFDDPEALEETKAINTALSCLKDCIRALYDGQTHIPFRRSPLTRLLKPALLGDSVFTAFIAHVAPTNVSALHTRNTLEYCRQLRSTAQNSAKGGGPDRWPATRLQRWVHDNWGNEHPALPSAFATISGRTMATMWRGELLRRVEAVGATVEVADQVYDAFHALVQQAKKRRRQKPSL